MADKRDQQVGGFSQAFNKVANWTSNAAGRASTFILAAGVVAVWAVTGPLFKFSDTWQLVINTGTTIVTFLMVFLIQNSQNRDNAAIQVKLDELIRTSAARNSFVGIEHLTDEELDDIRGKCDVGTHNPPRDRPCCRTRARPALRAPQQCLRNPDVMLAHVILPLLRPGCSRALHATKSAQCVDLYTPTPFWIRSLGRIHSNKESRNL
jgi:low affinity Fe/Cu permease